MHPINIYCAHLAVLEILRFIEYHTEYIIEKQNCPSLNDSLLLDVYGNSIQKNKKVVRFMDYHPGHHTKAFFYNVQLRGVHSCNEEDLFSPDN